MSAILIKTAKAKKTFTDSHGKKREVVDATPFRTDAETAAALLEGGGFRLARDRVVAPAPLAPADAVGADDGATSRADPGQAAGSMDEADTPSVDSDDGESQDAAELSE